MSGQNALIQGQQEPSRPLSRLFSLEVSPLCGVEAFKGWPEGPAPIWQETGQGWVWVVLWQLGWQLSAGL